MDIYKLGHYVNTVNNAKLASKFVEKSLDQEEEEIKIVLLSFPELRMRSTSTKPHLQLSLYAWIA